MRYRFQYVGADLRNLVHQPGIQRTLRDHEYGLVYRAICLFTPPAFAEYSSSLTTEGRLRLSIGLGAWFCAEMVLPVRRRSPTQTLTGLSVE